LRFAVPICVVGSTLLFAGWHMPGSAVIDVAPIVLVVLSPVLLFVAIYCVPRGFRAVRRLVDQHRAKRNPQPINRPIEQIAADLRRMLWQHDAFARSTDIPMRARRMCALEAAISRGAAQAARALDVPYPDRPAYAGFNRPQLRRLLRALAAEGLVLPATVGLLAPDRSL
jgi:hypothetical protein